MSTELLVSRGISIGGPGLWKLSGDNLLQINDRNGGFKKTATSVSEELHIGLILGNSTFDEDVVNEMSFSFML